MIDRHHECFTFCKICQVLTIVHQLICRGVANFGTRCTYILSTLTQSINFLITARLKQESKHMTIVIKPTTEHNIII